MFEQIGKPSYGPVTSTYFSLVCVTRGDKSSARKIIQNTLEILLARTYCRFVSEVNQMYLREMRAAFGVEAGSQSMFQEDHWVGFQSCFKLFQILGMSETAVL